MSTLLVFILLSVWFWLVAIVGQPAPVRSAGRPRRHRGFRRHWRKLYLLPIGLNWLCRMIPFANRSVIPARSLIFVNSDLEYTIKPFADNQAAKDTAAQIRDTNKAAGEGVKPTE